MSAPASATVITALDSSQVKNIGLGTIAVVVLIGLLLAVLVTKIVTKVIILVLALVLAVVVYQQRDRVASAVGDSAKRCEATFFGIHVQPHDPTIRKACQEASTKLPSK